MSPHDPFSARASLSTDEGEAWRVAHCFKARNRRSTANDEPIVLFSERLFECRGLCGELRFLSGACAGEEVV